MNPQQQPLSERKMDMPSKEYLEAKKEFINCWMMCIIGLGVPIVLAFKEWLPIMREEKRKERAGA